MLRDTARAGDKLAINGFLRIREYPKKLDDGSFSNFIKVGA